MPRPSHNHSKPCDRCGRVRKVDGRRKSNVCFDCRWSDPEYIRLTEGEPDASCHTAGSGDADRTAGCGTTAA